MSSFLKAERNGQLLKLTFEDPASKNAFSLRAARELRAFISKKDFDALIFTAAGRVFCSGGHLTDYAQMEKADEGRKVNDEIRDILAELTSIDRPTIACVQGDAFGGGVELMSCFDVVLCAPHVFLGLWQRKIGLTPGWGGGARIERRIGSQNFRRLSLTAETFSAREALALGLVDCCVSEAQLAGEALRLASRITKLPSEPLATFKRFNAENEARDFNSLWWNAAHRDVLANRRR